MEIILNRTIVTSYEHIKSTKLFERIFGFKSEMLNKLLHLS